MVPGLQTSLTALDENGQKHHEDHERAKAEHRRELPVAWF